jgi:glycosyltransferase involved in cell wall biosynthesis
MGNNLFNQKERDMRLSILLCSVPSRVKQFGVLEQLIEQSKGKDVEVLYLGDNWKQSIGEKRNHLVNMAKGDYVAFVDDDDRIALNYVDSLLRAMRFNDDVICFRVSITQDKGETWKPVYYSKDFRRDRNYPNKFERLPNHLMAFKRGLLLLVPFKHQNMGEDANFAIRIRKHLRTENIINKTLYFYNADRATSESIKRNSSK